MPNDNNKCPQCGKPWPQCSCGEDKKGGKHERKVA